MTKREIVRSVSEKLNLTQLETKDIVQNVFDTLAETLVTEGRVELRNFGVFEVRKRQARKARNPRTGEKVLVKECGRQLKSAARSSRAIQRGFSPDRWDFG